MKCTSCDTELLPGARECHACGAPVEESRVQPITQDDPPATLAKEPPIASSRPSSPYDAFSPVPAQNASTPDEGSPSTFSLPGEDTANGFVTGKSDEKVLGLPAESMGNIALGLGGAGCLFSIVLCGGLFSVLGLIAGFLALKTSGQRNGKIGLVLSGLGIIVTLIMLCVVLVLFLNANPR